MLQVIHRKSFEKDVQRLRKRGKDLAKLKETMNYLLENKAFPQKYKDHALIGQYKEHRECHIEPDWLLIYKKTADAIIFERTGTHADLFK